MAWRDWADEKAASQWKRSRRRSRSRRSRSSVRKVPKYTSRGVPVVTSLSDKSRLARRKAGGKVAVHAGHAAWASARFATRAIPIIGWGILAYDVYSFASWLAEKQSVKSPQAHVDPFLFENINDPRYVVGYELTPISPWRTM